MGRARGQIAIEGMFWLLSPRTSPNLLELGVHAESEAPSMP
jgi:hypothetical protein